MGQTRQNSLNIEWAEYDFNGMCPDCDLCRPCGHAHRLGSNHRCTPVSKVRLVERNGVTYSEPVMMIPEGHIDAVSMGCSTVPHSWSEMSLDMMIARTDRRGTVAHDAETFKARPLSREDFEHAHRVLTGEEPIPSFIDYTGLELRELEKIDPEAMERVSSELRKVIEENAPLVSKFLPVKR